MKGGIILFFLLLISHRVSSSGPPLPKVRKGGIIWHELEVGAAAEKVWKIYGTLQMPKLIEELGLVEKADVLEGDGGVGTVIWLHFPAGAPGPGSYKERFSVVDNHKRLKVADVVEGGYLKLGFSKYSKSIEIKRKSPTSCVIRSTVEYEIDDDSADISIVTTKSMQILAAAVAKRVSGHATDKP